MLHDSSRYDGDLVRFRFGSWEAAKGVFKSFGFGIFVYAAHEPTVTAFKEVFERLSKTPNSITVMVQYLSVMTITTLITLAAGSLLQRYTPKFFQVITGARG